MDLRCLYYKLAQIGWQRVLYWNRSVQSWMGNFTKHSAKGEERRKHLFFVHKQKERQQSEITKCTTYRSVNRRQQQVSGLLTSENDDDGLDSFTADLTYCI